MRIIIETDRAEGLSVSQEAAGETTAALATGAASEAMDGGGPPDHLLELLTGEPSEEPEDADGETARLAPEDAGSAPAWLVEVIEGSERSLSDSTLSEGLVSGEPTEL